MKHIQPFVLFEAKAARLPSGLTQSQEKFLNKYTEGTWSVNPSTGLVNVQGSFDCSYLVLFSFKGISFGHVSGNFNCFNNKLTSLEGSPQTVRGDFNCSLNQLTSLEGAPQTVNGNFWCSGNNLQSLVGAPQTVDGRFSCFNNKLTSLKGSPRTVGGDFVSDVIRLPRGKWNMEGWLEVLNTGTEEAKKLILTLPVFQPEYWNSKLKEKPKETILQMVPIWDDLPSNIQDEIQIPSNWKDSFDNLLDLERAGIF